MIEKKVYMYIGLKQQHTNFNNDDILKDMLLYFLTKRTEVRENFNGLG